MPLGGIIAGAGALGAAGIGALSNSSNSQNQQQAIQNAINQFTSIGVPPAQATQIVMQQYQNAGQLTPELEQAVNQAGSGLSNIQTNPQDTQAQMNALGSLQQIGSNGGMNLADKSNLAQDMANVQTHNRGAQEAILANAQSRGQLGGGAALAAQLSAQQNGANQANLNGLNIAGQAQQRALQSLMGAGQLGGQMQAQEYGQKANAAQAQDAINRFNTANQQNVANTNAQLGNYAQQYNLGNQQNINNMNTGVQNAQTQYNAQQIQQNFNNQLSKAGGASGQLGNLGNFYGQQAQNNSNLWGGVGQGVAQAGSAYGQQQNFNNFLDRVYPQQKQNPLAQTSGNQQWAGSDDNNGKIYG